MPGRRLDAASSSMTATAYEGKPNGCHDQEHDDENNDHVDGNGHGQASSGDTRDTDDEQGLSRHGFDSSEEVLLELQSRYFLYFTDTRHVCAGRAKPLPYSSPPDWRSKDKIKIGHGALVVCLRIGFDPPDVIKTTPCARLEAWVDTASVGRDRAMEQIAANLQKQYQSLAMSSKAKFTTYMDPAHEDLRKLCVGLRRKARGDRAVFHYNGHGVPRPTSSGEIWVFNRQYTQYIPVAVADIVGYLGGPSLYLWDCSNAGYIVQKIQDLQSLPEGKFPAPSATTTPAASQSAGQSSSQGGASTEGTATPPVAISNIQDIIQLAACQSHETLPMNPDLPADLFTSCVTSPIEMSIRFFILHNPLRSELSLDMGMNIPGKLSDRKTPLGELVWIFTSVTDTIAWNTIPRHLFQRLFRHDLVMAAIFRGFLLAERIMKRYDCNPISVPALPSCANHPLWDSWDLALDRCLAQMPALIAYEEEKERAEALGEPAPPPVVYSHSYFFADHLSAFSVWIDQGTARTVDASFAFLEKGQMLTNGHKRTLPSEFGKSPTKQLTNGSGITGQHTNGPNGSIIRPQKGSAIPVTIAGLNRYHKTLRVQSEHPEHLPILLQVLLSQVHRLRALMLLCKFLDLGPWAVNLGLAIGIFPYVLKLLQAPGPELRPVLIYIWARILAIYRLCQEDLAKAAGLPSARNGGKPELPFHYFAGVLDPHQQMLVIPNVSEHRAMCAFITAIFMRDYPFGQQLALTSLPPNSRSNVFESCLFHLKDEDPLLRQWSALCIGVLWDDFDEAKGLGVRLKAHSELTAQMHQDPVPEVRASIMYALGVFIGTTAGDALTGKSNAGRSLSGSAVERTGLNEQWQADEELGVAMSTLKMQNDASPLVRRELVILLSAVVYNHRGNFVVSAYDHAMEQKAGVRRNPAEVFEERINIMEHSLRHMDPNKPSASTYSMEFRAIMFSCMYMTILDLAADPFPDVSERANIMLDYIHEELLDSHLSLVSGTGKTDNTDSEGEDDLHSAGSGLSSRDSQQRLASSMEKPKTTAAQALKALNRLGFGAPSFDRQPSSASPPLSGRSRLSPGTKLPTSKSTAHLGDLASTSRTLRHVSSADSLLQQATANAAKQSASLSSARSSVRHPDTPLLSVAEAKAMLFQSDADRLKRSRQTPAPVIVTPARVASPVPVTPNPTLPPPPLKEYVPSTTISDAQGRPRSHDLPFRSELFDWSTEYFISPQMKEKESDEPGSVEYNERHWRRERNERIIVATQGLKDAAASSRWDQLDAELDLTSTPEQIVFHQFEPHIATADSQGNIRINDWQQRRCINRFSVLAPLDDRPASADAKITTLKFVNDDDAALLLTGTSDGSVRIFRDYESPRPFLVTGWKALSQMIPSTNHEAGLICEWQQGKGRLLAGGNAKEIKIWDAPTEVCQREIPTRSNSCLTSLTSDQVVGDIIVAGFGDGAVRAYDTRLPPRETMVQAWRGVHRSWIKNVHMQRGGNRELLSGSLTGEICMWDIRSSEPVRIFQAHQGGLTQMAVHEHAPVLATGSEAGIVKVWNMFSDEPISRFRNTTATRAFSSREGVHPVVSMMFHPHEMVLGVGATDAKLNIYHCQV